MTTKNQAKGIVQIYKWILHSFVEIVDTKPVYYNDNRYTNNVIDIYNFCSKKEPTIDNLEKLIDLCEDSDCYINEKGDFDINYFVFWRLYHAILGQESDENYII